MQVDGTLYRIIKYSSFLQELKVHSRVHIPSQINPVPILTPYFFKINVNIKLYCYYFEHCPSSSSLVKQNVSEIKPTSSCKVTSSDGSTCALYSGSNRFESRHGYAWFSSVPSDKCSDSASQATTSSFHIISNSLLIKST
jgi:hypothetical protein